ncbi:MAG: hypothetical protein ACI4AM_01310 [Muribaculaceae bacterium]
MKHIFRLICLAVMACVTISASAESLWAIPEEIPDKPFSGSGTQTDPYRISTAHDMVVLSYICKKASASYTKGKYYVLTTDIVLNDVSEPFTQTNYSSYTKLPIKLSGGVFCGNFDGRGHTITGLVFHEDYDFGLFGNTENATISNVTLDYVALPVNKSYAGVSVLTYKSENTVFNNVHIKNVSCFYQPDVWKDVINYGTFAYSADDTVVFNDCSVQIQFLEEIYGGYYGGFVAKNNGDLYFNRCKADGKICIKGTASSDYAVGGFIGYNYDNLFINQCLSTVDIQNPCNSYKRGLTTGVGGIVGLHNGYTLSINESAYIGNIELNNPISNDYGLGGLIGNCDEDAECTNCAVISKISLNNTGPCYGYFGQLIGNCQGDVTVNNCVIASKSSYSSTETAGDDIVDPVIADDSNSKTLKNSGNIYHYVTLNSSPMESSRITNATYCSDLLTNDAYLTTLNSGSSRTIWGRYNNESSSFNGAPLPVACGGILSARKGSGTETEPYLIETEEDLRQMQEESRSMTTIGVYYKLNADISMSSEAFPAIGYDVDHAFQGHFDGAGHHIRGMVASDGSLFRYMCGTVENLALVDFSAVEGCENVAPIALIVGTGSTLTGTVKNCYASGDLW